MPACQMADRGRKHSKKGAECQRGEPRKQCGHAAEIMQADVDPRDASAKEPEAKKKSQPTRALWGVGFLPEVEESRQGYDGGWIEIEWGVAENDECTECNGEYRMTGGFHAGWTVLMSCSIIAAESAAQF